MLLPIIPLVLLYLPTLLLLLLSPPLPSGPHYGIATSTVSLLLGDGVVDTFYSAVYEAADVFESFYGRHKVTSTSADFTSSPFRIVHHRTLYVNSTGSHPPLYFGPDYSAVASQPFINATESKSFLLLVRDLGAFLGSEPWRGAASFIAVAMSVMPLWFVYYLYRVSSRVFVQIFVWLTCRGSTAQMSVCSPGERVHPDGL